MKIILAINLFKELVKVFYSMSFPKKCQKDEVSRAILNLRLGELIIKSSGSTVVVIIKVQSPSGIFSALPQQVLSVSLNHFNCLGLYNRGYCGDLALLMAEREVPCYLPGSFISSGPKRHQGTWCLMEILAHPLTGRTQKCSQKGQLTYVS